MTLQLISLAALLQTFGALIGAGMTTFAEIFYIEAAADGKIDHHERKYLRRMYNSLRFGMSVVVISGIALIVLEYLVPDAPQDVLVAPFWALETLILIVVLLGRSISEKVSEWWVASSAVLAGWWMILFIDLGFANSFGYIQILVLYMFLTFLFASLFGYARVFVREHIGKKFSTK
jgi:hypothetical protein